jgi:hypothetical protein
MLTVSRVATIRESRSGARLSAGLNIRGQWRFCPYALRHLERVEELEIDGVRADDEGVRRRSFALEPRLCLRPGHGRRERSRTQPAAMGNLK